MQKGIIFVRSREMVNFVCLLGWMIAYRSLHLPLTLSLLTSNVERSYPLSHVGYQSPLQID